MNWQMILVMFGDIHPLLPFTTIHIYMHQQRQDFFLLLCFYKWRNMLMAHLIINSVFNSRWHPLRPPSWEKRCKSHVPVSLAPIPFKTMQALLHNSYWIKSKTKLSEVFHKVDEELLGRLYVYMVVLLIFTFF